VNASDYKGFRRSGGFHNCVVTGASALVALLLIILSVPVARADGFDFGYYVGASLSYGSVFTATRSTQPDFSNATTMGKIAIGDNATFALSAPGTIMGNVASKGSVSSNPSACCNGVFLTGTENAMVSQIGPSSPWCKWSPLRSCQWW
jgi:hypothetical protein